MPELPRQSETLTTELNAIYEQVRMWLDPETVTSIYADVKKFNRTPETDPLNPKDRLIGLYSSVAAFTHKAAQDFDGVVYPQGGTDVACPAHFSNSVLTVDEADIFGSRWHGKENEIDTVRRSVITYLKTVLQQGYHSHHQDLRMYGYAANLWLIDAVPGSINVEQVQRYKHFLQDYAKVGLTFELPGNRTIEQTALTGITLKDQFSDMDLKDVWVLQQLQQYVAGKRIMALSKAGLHRQASEGHAALHGIAPFYTHLPDNTTVVSDESPSKDLYHYYLGGGRITDLINDDMVPELREIHEQYVQHNMMFGFGYAKHLTKDMNIFQLRGKN